MEVTIKSIPQPSSVKTQEHKASASISPNTNATQARDALAKEDITLVLQKPELPKAFFEGPFNSKDIDSTKSALPDLTLSDVKSQYIDKDESQKSYIFTAPQTLGPNASIEVAGLAEAHGFPVKADEDTMAFTPSEITITNNQGKTKSYEAKSYAEEGKFFQAFKNLSKVAAG